MKKKRTVVSMNDSGVYTSNRYFENFPGPSVTGCRLLAISQMRAQIVK